MNQIDLMDEFFSNQNIREIVTYQCWSLNKISKVIFDLNKGLSAGENFFFKLIIPQLPNQQWKTDFINSLSPLHHFNKNFNG